MCGRNGVKYINHDELFIAPSGAPRLALYQDTLYPSPKDTAQLAKKLFNKGRERRNHSRDDYDRSDKNRQDHRSRNQSQKSNAAPTLLPPPFSTGVITVRVPSLLRDSTRSSKPSTPPSPPSHYHDTSKPEHPSPLSACHFIQHHFQATK